MLTSSCFLPAEETIKLPIVNKPVRGCGFGNPIFPLTGTKRLRAETGISIGGTPLVLHYDTQRNKSAAAAGVPVKDFGDAPSFGPQWSSNLHKRLVLSKGQMSVQAFRGDGSVASFNYVAGAYTTDEDVAETLRIVSGSLQLISAAQAIETYNYAGQLLSVANPDGSKLRYTYSDASTSAAVAPAPGYLIQIADQNGRVIRFEYRTPSGGAPSSDAMVSKVIDSAGQSFTAAYDTAANLTALRWADGKVRSYVYENPVHPWALTGVIDENNVRYATYGYDAQGNATSTELAGGVDKYTASYATPPAVQLIRSTDPSTGYAVETTSALAPTGVTITKPEGQTTQLSNVALLGVPRLVEMSQPAGSGCNAANSRSSFDAAANLTSKDDFSGNRSCYAYDAKNQETTRVEGLAKTIDCASVLPVNATLPANARKTTTSYHPDWRVASRVESAGRITHNIYQGQPDPFNANQLANCTAAPNMPNGKPLPLLCKQVIQAALPQSASVPNVDSYFANVSLLLHGDGPNNSTSIVDSGRNPKTVVVNGNARISTDQSKFGGASIYLDGNSYLSLASTGDMDIHASDFTLETWIMVKAWTPGTALIAANWRHPTYQYNLQIIPSGVYFDTQVAGVGTSAVKTQAMSLNAWYHIAVVRKGTSLTTYLDGVPGATVQLTSMTAETQDMQIGRNPVDGTYYFNGYLDDFRITKGVSRYLGAFTPPTAVAPDATSSPDQTSIPDTTVAAVVTQYTYDSAGRILTAKDSLGRTTSYAYYTDTAFTGVDPTAVGHTVGDLQSVTNAAGQVTRYEQYDKAGRNIQSTDAKGNTTTISYTPRGWVSQVSVTAPGQSARTTNYAYDNVGQLTGVTNPDGSTISYSYDAAHRLIGAKDAKGNTVAYTLDNMGNRIKEDIKDPSGVLQRSISRSFDALNRVQQVTGAAQ